MNDVDEIEETRVGGFFHGLFWTVVGMILAAVAVVGVGWLVWTIIQGIWTLFLIFLQGAGPSTGNFQDPSYGTFIEE
ncbi:hypothetical protein H3N89_gp31 [Microbacterium phage MonChoix]|uniref:Uncharacterized protein n=1 Tax=Microbacterium phage MonChoix TaxID=2590880 RepID=A0A4Y6EBE8_9CAUD|nr:hypothetical protein H3N89_gp31 [Microbacterium phage MonChoix]QDF15996.1 hypothetical protein SEA_MONCHOIX_31 [Microbacterium phage MonChoix]